MWSLEISPAHTVLKLYSIDILIVAYWNVSLRLLGSHFKNWDQQQQLLLNWEFWDILNISRFLFNSCSVGFLIQHTDPLHIYSVTCCCCRCSCVCRCLSRRCCIRTCRRGWSWSWCCRCWNISNFEIQHKQSSHVAIWGSNYYTWVVAMKEFFGLVQNAREKSSKN